MSELTLQIGIGGIMGGELFTYDFTKGEKLKPYVCKIKGRDFKYKFEREFVDREFLNIKKKFYSTNLEMRAMVFKLERFVVYEYKRFPAQSLGEIVEGYFVILSDRIQELEEEEVFHWCKTAREKGKAKSDGRAIFAPQKNFAPDDIDF